MIFMSVDIFQLWTNTRDGACAQESESRAKHYLKLAVEAINISRSTENDRESVKSRKKSLSAPPRHCCWNVFAHKTQTELHLHANRENLKRWRLQARSDRWKERKQSHHRRVLAANGNIKNSCEASKLCVSCLFSFDVSGLRLLFFFKIRSCDKRKEEKNYLQGNSSSSFECGKNDLLNVRTRQTDMNPERRKFSVFDLIARLTLN